MPPLRALIPPEGHNGGDAHHEDGQKKWEYDVRSISDECVFDCHFKIPEKE